MDFGTWLAAKRREAGVTLRELAKKSGLSLPYVAGLERGTSEEPPLKTCKGLARALSIDWAEMWQRSFTARLKKWLKRQGYSVTSEAELLDLVKKIESISR